MWVISSFISQVDPINWAICTDLKKILIDEANETLESSETEDPKDVTDKILLAVLRALLAWMWICIELAIFL